MLVHRQDAGEISSRLFCESCKNCDGQELIRDTLCQGFILLRLKPVCFADTKQTGFLLPEKKMFDVGDKMQIDYYAYQSGMKNVNAGIKVFLSVGTLFMVILQNKIPVSLFVVFSMGFLTLFVGKTPFKVYLHLMTIPLTFMILSGAAIAVQFTKTPVGEWYVSARFFYLCVTRKSLFTAIEVFFKALAGMSALYMLALSTPVNELILVLQKLHLPKLLAELMNLIYRYIFILFEVAGQMQTAAKARLGYGSFRQSLRTFAGVAGNLFLVSLKKAGAYYDALLARGYDGKLEFLTEDKPLKLWQAGSCILYFAVMVMIAAAA